MATAPESDTSKVTMRPNTVTDDDIRKATDRLEPDELEHLFANLGIPSIKIANAKQSANTDDTELQTRAVLYMWRKMKGSNFTQETLFDERDKILEKRTGHNSRFHLTISELKDHTRIGRGSYGDVFRVSFNRPTYGDKFEGYSVAAAKNLFKLRESEVNILRNAKHPNIVKFLDYIYEGMSSVIVTELADISLRDRLTNLNKQDDKASDEIQAKWIRESAEPIKYLHDGMPDENGLSTCKFVVHRDVKAANCLLFGDVLKLCDFGTARELDQSTETTSNVSGTKPFMAPELLNTRKFSTATDIFAYGVLMWEITTHEKPEVQEDNTHLLGQPINTYTHTFPDYLQKLLPECWKKEYKERPTIGQIIEQLPQEAAMQSSSVSADSTDSNSSVPDLK